MLISIFSKDQSKFLCKGYQTILDQNLRFGLLTFFLYQMQRKNMHFAIEWQHYIEQTYYTQGSNSDGFFSV